MTKMATFSAGVLEKWARSVLESLGVPKDDARITAEVLVLGNLRGIDSHGLRLLIKNSEGLKDGALNPKPNMRAVKETASCLLFDGDGGMGQLVCCRAMDAAIEKVKNSGVAVAVTTNASHCGMSAAYVLRAAQKGLIGMIMSNNKASMALTGGYDWSIGNNTIACAIPTTDAPPIVLDMTTALLNWGKVAALAAAGVELPDDAMIWRKPQGGVLKDASRAYKEGTVLPIGGHKGSGLAVIIEVLTGVLSGGPFAGEVGTVFLDTSKKEHQSQFMLVVSPEVFMPSDVFTSRVNNLVEYIKNSPKLDGIEDILLPGEKEHRCMQERHKEGVPISAVILEGLNSLSAQLGIDPLSDN